METPLPNRLAAYGTAAIALLAGLAPLIGNLDWESTAGVVAALGALLAVVVKWLDGWQKWERGEGDALLPGELDDDYDEETAEPIPEPVVAAANAGEGTTYDPAESQRANPPGFTSPPPKS